VNKGAGGWGCCGGYGGTVTGPTGGGIRTGGSAGFGWDCG
jgi:hypothetical protein